MVFCFSIFWLFWQISLFELFFKDLVRVLTQPCNHSVLLSQPCHFRANQRRDGAVCRLPTGMEWHQPSECMQWGLSVALKSSTVLTLPDSNWVCTSRVRRFRILSLINTPGVSIRSNGPMWHTTKSVCHIGPFDPRPFRGIVYMILYWQVPADSAVSFDIYRGVCTVARSV